MEDALNPTLRRLLGLCRLDRQFVRGEGVWLFDRDGRRYLDAAAQYGALVLGHNPAVATRALREALDASEPAMLQPYPARWADALAEELWRRTPGNLKVAAFTTSGAETVEAAMKLVRARTGRPIILAAEGSFHGKTLGALSLTGQPHHAAGFGALPGDVAHVPFGDAAALAAAFAAGAGGIAALFLEPVQGERGVHVPPPGYLAEARRLCTAHGAALVLDEIQTGLGRTGRLFACEHEAVVPDLLLLAKGLGGGLFPLGACLCGDDFWDERFALGHSSTFANNNLACRVGLAVLQEIVRADLPGEAVRKGARLRAGLDRLAARYGGVIAAARGQGLLGALELRPPAEGGLFLGYLAHQGLYPYAVAATLAELASVLVLPTLGTGNVIRVAPPLSIGDEELDLVLDGLESLAAQLDRNAAETIVRGIGALADRPAARRTAAARAGAGGGEAIRRTVALPPPPGATGRRTPRPSYAFLVHYTRPEDVRTTDPGLARLGDEEIERYLAFLSEVPAGVVLRAPPIRSPATGAVAEGWIIALPWIPAEMFCRGRAQVGAAIARGVDLARELGAHVVGLGGFTTPFSKRGRLVVGRGIAVTTGNALTAGMAFAATRRAAAAAGMSLGEEAVAVVGARGSVGALLARQFARARPRRLVLVGNPAGDLAPLAALAAELGHVEVATDLGVLGGCRIVASATGAARPVLDAAPLGAGTLICDVALPPDASPRLRARRDVTVIDGALVALPDPGVRFGAGNIQGLPPGVQLACLSETILHCLAGTERDFGVGDDVPLGDVDAAMALAAEHGFRPAAGARAADGGAGGRGRAMAAAAATEPAP
jgi:acetylornithine/succinyldiaminopimelate/putrescine aminotransferase/predicted amino acid dehydrogenase